MKRHLVPPLQVIPYFVVGRDYYRKREITGIYGGSGQSGIAPSKQAAAVFIFTGSSGEQYGYQDEIDEDGFLTYTGEGQEGDMVMVRGNRAIATHTFDGRALYVFKTQGHGQPCEYMGEFIYISHFYDRGGDKNGKDRQVIRFLLAPAGIDILKAQGLSIQESHANYTKPTLDILRERALRAIGMQDNYLNSNEAKRLVYRRSEDIKQYVLARANGLCECCEKPAPFLRLKDSTPYLEPHHINRLSDGGLDHPNHMAALCPNCHREIHHGRNGVHINNWLRVKIKDLGKEIS
ncbi:HNH endonuclease [Chromobacterium sphagni]|uniref:HNH endonuclease n=1 Tax=Chromobacterium sphagni TaxID=1903179 RepID=UPI000A485B9C|nr:HNH endonuclease [Chromobacterium sphagni]